MPNNQDVKISSHIHVLDHLRGVAALAVCLFHFSCGNTHYLPEADPVRSIASVGWLGIEVFFVISGFIIPYSLARRSYRLQDAGRFLIKRVKRLEPPYLSCILLVIGLNLLSSITPGFQGAAFNLSATQLLLHLGYMNAFVGREWLNPAFWTLAIEFQYYIFIALVFPALNHHNLVLRVTSLIAITLMGLCDFQNTALLFHWLPLFAMGISSYQLINGGISNLQYILLLLLVTPVCCYTIGIYEALAGVLVALLIARCGTSSIPTVFKPLAMVGTISYSLYLTHIPVGGRIINLAIRLPDYAVYRYAGVAVAFTVSIAFAYVFWRFVEVPAQRWSQADNSEPPMLSRQKPGIALLSSVGVDKECVVAEPSD